MSPDTLCIIFLGLFIEHTIGSCPKAFVCKTAPSWNPWSNCPGNCQYGVRVRNKGFCCPDGMSSNECVKHCNFTWDELKQSEVCKLEKSCRKAPSTSDSSTVSVTSSQVTSDGTSYQTPKSSVSVSTEILAKTQQSPNTSIKRGTYTSAATNPSTTGQQKKTKTSMKVKTFNTGTQVRTTARAIKSSTTILLQTFTNVHTSQRSNLKLTNLVSGGKRTGPTMSSPRHNRKSSLRAQSFHGFDVTRPDALLMVLVSTSGALIVLATCSFCCIFLAKKNRDKKKKRRAMVHPLEEDTWKDNVIFESKNCLQ